MDIFTSIPFNRNEKTFLIHKKKKKVEKEKEGRKKRTKKNIGLSNEMRKKIATS